MDNRANRRSGPQRNLLLYVLLISVGAISITYYLVARTFAKATLALTQRIEIEAGLQVKELGSVASTVQNQSRFVAYSVKDSSDLQIARIDRLSEELKNHSRLVALAIEKQSDIHSTEVREISRDVRNTLRAQPESPNVGKMIEMLDNQTRYSMATLRAQRRLEKGVVEVLKVLQDMSDTKTESQSSNDKTLQGILATMQKHTEIQQTAQQTLDALSGLIAAQDAAAGGQTSSAEQEKIHAVLKALVSHLRNQEKEGSSYVAQTEALQLLEGIMNEVRNQTAIDGLRREVRFQSSTITQLRERLIDLETKLPTLADLANVKKAETDGLGGEEGDETRKGNGSPELQAAIIGLLQEVRKQTIQITEVQEKVVALEGESRGNFEGKDGEESVSVLQMLLIELRNQTKLISNLDQRMSTLENKVGETTKGNGEGVTGDGEKGEGAVERLSEEVPVKTDVTPELKVDVGDPGSWMQQQLAGSPTFVRFSGYRIGEAKMAAIGVMTEARTDPPKVDNCRWEGRGSTIMGDAKTLLTGEKDNKPYVVVVIHCTFPSPISSQGGYLIASINDEPYTLYREEIGQFVDLAPQEPFPHLMTMCISPLTQTVDVSILREFVEFHRLSGIDRFVFYDSGGFGNKFRENFGTDIRNRDVVIAPFYGMEKYEQQARGQLLAFHDCLYSSIFSSQWVAFLEAHEYLWVAPPSTLKGFLDLHKEKDWISHGSVWWAADKCCPFDGTDSLDGDRFSIERMVFRWPYVLCHDTEKFTDRKFCLGDTGHRKLIVNPRKVQRMELYGVHASEEANGEHISADTLLHLHYQRLLEGPSVLCTEIIQNNETIVFWYRNFVVSDYAKSLRQGHHCNFSAEGCMVSLKVEESSELGARQEEGEAFRREEVKVDTKNTENESVEKKEAGQNSDVEAGRTDQVQTHEENSNEGKGEVLNDFGTQN